MKHLIDSIFLSRTIYIPYLSYTTAILTIHRKVRIPHAPHQRARQLLQTTRDRAGTEDGCLEVTVYPCPRFILGERRYQVRRRGKSNGRKTETITRTRAGKIPFVLKRGVAKGEGYDRRTHKGHA